MRIPRVRSWAFSGSVLAFQASQGRKRGATVRSAGYCCAFRICFVWREGDAYDVEIVDYH